MRDYSKENFYKKYLRFYDYINIIVGYRKGVIYDFKSKKAFEINKEISYLLAKLFNGQCTGKQIAEKIRGGLEKYRVLHLENKIDTFLSWLLQGNIIETQKNRFKKKRVRNNLFEKERLLGRGRTSNPRSILIETTSKCNFYCPHCYLNITGRNHYVHTLPLNILTRAFGELNRLEVKDIQFTGGEPFLREDLDKVIINAKKYRFKIYITSNGSIISKEMLRLIKDSDIKIQITLYGMNPKAYRLVSNDAKVFYRIIDTIYRILSLNSRNLSLAMPLMTPVISEIPKFIKFCKGNNIRYSFGRIFKFGRAAKNWNQISPSDKQIESLRIGIKEIISESKKVIFYKKSLKFPKTKDCIEIEQNTSFIDRACNSRAMAILADGTVTPCSFLRDKQFQVGNIFQNSIKKIWFSSKNLNFRKFNVDSVDICSKCEYKYICGGECPAAAYGECGDIYSPYPYCQIYPSIIRSYYDQRR